MAFTRNGSTVTPAQGGNTLARSTNTALTAQQDADLTAYEWTAGEQRLTVTLSDAQRLFCPDATPVECRIFIETCKAYHLNPFIKDAYLIHYDNKREETAATIVLGKSAYMQRAEMHPQFDGYEAGIIVLTDGKIDLRAGTFYLKDAGEELLGGWAKVYRKDRSIPYYEEVNLKEYDTGKSQWGVRPATMIRKVALVHALREAFPSAYGNLYDESEIQVDAEGTARELDDDPLSETKRQRFAARHAMRQLKQAPQPAETAPDGDGLTSAGDSDADPFGGDEG